MDACLHDVDSPPQGVDAHFGDVEAPPRLAIDRKCDRKRQINDAKGLIYYAYCLIYYLLG